MKPLYKTTVVIWSEYDGEKVELSSLAHEAESGDAYCSRYGSELISDPATDEAWDGTEFFGVDYGEDEPEGTDSPARPEDAIDSVLGAIGASDEASQRISRVLGG